MFIVNSQSNKRRINSLSKSWSSSSNLLASGDARLQKSDRMGGLFVFLRAGIPVGFLVENEIPDFNTKAHVLAIAVDGIRTGEIEIVEAV